MLRKEELRSTLCVPIVVPEMREGSTIQRCLGCLQLLNKVPRGVAWDADRTSYTASEFRSRDEAHARSFCEQISKAILAAQLVQERREAEARAASEKEARRRERRARSARRRDDGDSMKQPKRHHKNGAGRPAGPVSTAW